MRFFGWSAHLFGRFGDRWTDETVADIAGQLRPFVEPGGAILDLGGGTGALAARLATVMKAKVTILDPTPEMLAYVPDHAGVTAQVGSAEEMPFSEGEFDACVVSDAFHHFRDQNGAVREMKRVVRPGGGIVILELDPTRIFMRLLVLAERLVGEPASFFKPHALAVYMSQRGVAGHSEHTQGSSYRFVGSVKETPHVSG